MENHGINMKGKYFMESVSGPAAGTSANGRRVIFNTSTSINGTTDAFGQYKMFFHNQTQWARPLLANVNDGPHADNTITLGSGSYRFSKIYSADFYGAVRYS